MFHIPALNFDDLAFVQELSGKIVENGFFLLTHLFIEELEVPEEVGVFVIFLLSTKVINAFLRLFKGSRAKNNSKLLLVELVDGTVFQWNLL